MEDDHDEKTQSSLFPSENGGKHVSGTGTSAKKGEEEDGCYLLNAFAQTNTETQPRLI